MADEQYQTSASEYSNKELVKGISFLFQEIIRIVITIIMLSTVASFYWSLLCTGQGKALLYTFSYSLTTTLQIPTEYQDLRKFVKVTELVNVEVG